MMSRASKARWDITKISDASSYIHMGLISAHDMTPILGRGSDHG